MGVEAIYFGVDRIKAVQNVVAARGESVGRTTRQRLFIQENDKGYSLSQVRLAGPGIESMSRFTPRKYFVKKAK
jgi:hypothetical protein